jgi:hypothetical protein
VLKAGEKRKLSKPDILAQFFSHPLTVRIVADLLTYDDTQLISFFQQGYAAIETLGGEVTKSAVGLGDPEKLIRLAGEKAPDVVRSLGARIEGLAERIQG